jgi:hypothetical protein
MGDARGLLQKWQRSRARALHRIEEDIVLYAKWESIGGMLRRLGASRMPDKRGAMSEPIKNEYEVGRPNATPYKVLSYLLYSPTPPYATAC